MPEQLQQEFPSGTLNCVLTVHVGDTIEVSHGTPEQTSSVEVLAIRGATAYLIVRHAPGGGGLSRVVPPHQSLADAQRDGRRRRRVRA
jgi:hypothetical protein